jgi:hypothetical protein
MKDALLTCSLIAVVAMPHALVAQAGGTGAGTRARPSAVAAREAFDRLVTLEGVWEGTTTSPEDGTVLFQNARFDYRVTGGGSALMELANAGTADEMLSIFYMEGDRLVLQHYCSAGNQPRMELVRADRSELLFDLVGGDNFDPAVDGHIHRVRFTFGSDQPVESFWSWFEGAGEDHVARRVLRERVAAR